MLINEVERHDGLLAARSIAAEAMFDKLASGFLIDPGASPGHKKNASGKPDMTRTPLPRTPNRLDPIEGSRALDEQMLGMIVALASEVTVLRARLDAAERLLAENGALPPGAVDGYEPDDAAQQERAALREATMNKVFRPLREAAQKELEAVQETSR